MEVMVSSLILGLCLLGALSLFGFSMTMVQKTGDQGVAYNIARKAIEHSRELGFDYHNQPDGTTTLYFDTFGTWPGSTTASTSGFKMVETISSDKLATQNGVTFPADDALRTVIVQVYTLPSNQLVEQSGTLLARSGV